MAQDTSSSFNPYAAPAAPVEDVAANSEAEAIRRAHISHEASIKAAGLLYYLGGFLVTVAAIFTLFGPQKGGGLLVALFLLALAVGQFLAGSGVRALRPWGRIVGGVISGIGLLGFPIGTLINGYILYLLLSKKGRTIFAPQYQQVIAATPHVRYRTSIVVWIFLALLIAVMAFGVLAPLLGR
jgi:hypothetical protein